jgi:DNA-binding beta-propeller fold protein YncE
MAILTKSVGAVFVGSLLCVVLVMQGANVGDGTTTVAQAQEDNWTTDAARRQGIRLVETRDASGPPAYPVEPGDLLFFTNVGTSYGATNPKNSIVVIDAKTKKPIAISDLEAEWSEKWYSHGNAVSPDGRYVYLPGIRPRGTDSGPEAAGRPSSILVLDSRTLKIHQIISSGAERPHHVKQYEDWLGRRRILVEDFNWIPNFSPNGKGFYVLDPDDDNKVIAGMTPGEVRGNLYAGFTAPDGKYLYYSAPPSDFTIRTQLQGYMTKIDMETWEVVQRLPMETYPIWTVFSRDNRWAWTTQSEDSKLLKIERAMKPGGRDRIVGEAPTGPGPYGAAITLDESEVWVADKGETLPGMRGTSATVIDADTMEVKRTIQTDCITNDHLIVSPDGREMWATCNQSHEIVVLDTATYEIKTRIPMPNQGDTHGGSFVFYSEGAGGLVAETVSDQNGLHGSAREAARQAVPWAPAGY